MIAFERALKLVLANTPVLAPAEKKIEKLRQEILARNVISPLDLPVFTNSAMDGFAVRSQETQSAPVTLKVSGLIKAGDPAGPRVGRGETVKIMTGAPLPPGADAVVMKEDTEEKDERALVKRSVRRGENVRYCGEELRKGRVALKKGTRLNPAAIGLLSAMGMSRVLVFETPAVSLLVTGNELVKPGMKLGPAQIFESNAAVLGAAMEGMGLGWTDLGIARDDPRDLERRIKAGLKTSDILLVCGGISVGDYDLVQDVLFRTGVEKIFWRVAMKPGKPTFFGRKGRTLVFGVPGNPVSGLIVFLELVRPAVLKMAGHRDILLPERNAILEERLTKKLGRMHFLRGISRVQDGRIFVRSAGMQESHILASTAVADCLVMLDRKREVLEKGEEVRIQILPWSES